MADYIDTSADPLGRARKNPSGMKSDELDRRLREERRKQRDRLDQRIGSRNSSRPPGERR